MVFFLSFYFERFERGRRGSLEVEPRSWKSNPDFFPWKWKEGVGVGSGRSRACYCLPSLSQPGVGNSSPTRTFRVIEGRQRHNKPPVQVRLFGLLDVAGSKIAPFLCSSRHFEVVPLPISGVFHFLTLQKI